MSQPTSGKFRHMYKKERRAGSARRRNEASSTVLSPRARTQEIADRIQKTRDDMHTQDYYNSLIEQADQRRERERLELERSQRRSNISRGKRVVIVEEDSSDDPTYQVEDEESSEMKEYINEFAGTEPQQENPQGEPEQSAEAYYIEALLSRDFKGTRYPHRPTMGALGITNDIYQLLTNTGMGKLATSYCDGYREETCHLLATLALHFDDDEMQGYITFSVRGREYELSVMELAGVYGFPTEENSDSVPKYDGQELASLWATIGVLKYGAGKSKSTWIRSPVLRYFHKVIANVMFAKPTTGHVKEGELGLVGKGLKPLMHYTTDGYPMQGDRANSSLTRILLENLMGYKAWAASGYGRNKGGTLLIGGIVTPILRACNVPITGKGVAAKMIDLTYLKSAHFFDGALADQKYQFIHPEFGVSTVLLPNEELTTIVRGMNIDFRPNKEALFSCKGKAKIDGAEEVEEEVETVNTRVAKELDEPSCYYFEESPKTKKGKTAAAAHANLKKIQRWQKFQDNFITKKFKEMTSQIKKLTIKLNKATSSKKPSSTERLERSHSFQENSPQPQIQQQHRHSSVDPATFQRKKRHHKEGGGSSHQQQFPQSQEIEQQHTFDQEQMEQGGVGDTSDYFSLMSAYMDQD